MEVKENLKTLANSILDSYEKRVKTVNVLMEQSYHFFKEYQLELDEMMEQLKDNLARVESLRKRDFDRMMKDITERQRSQEDGAEEVFDHFKDEETEMIGRLRKIIISGNRSNLEDVEAIREDILKRQKERENSIIRVIKRFRVEQRELGIALKRLLSKGEYVRIKDFKLMLKSLTAQHDIQDTELDDMMEDLEIARNWVQAEWQAVSRASG